MNEEEDITIKKSLTESFLVDEDVDDKINNGDLT
jgi:hypothetical protein